MTNLLIKSEKQNKDALTYPRVLVISSSNFNLYTGSGILLTNLFKGWPTSNIALIYKDDFLNDENICKLSYKLSFKDYSFPLSILANFEQETQLKSEKCEEIDTEIPQKKAANRVNAKAKLRKVYEVLNSAIGGPEVYSKYVLSHELIEWINQFNPQILYCHVSSIMNIRFVSEIQKLLKVPLCIHIMDDFFNIRYTKGIFASKLKVKLYEEFISLISQTSLRMGIGDKMCKAYEKEFGFSFLPFFNAVDPTIWLNPFNVKKQTNEIFKIVYAGTINNKNICNLEVLSKVVEQLNSMMQICQLEILTFNPRVELYRPILERKPFVTMAEVPNDDENMISLLKGADLLYLPVDFTKESIERMRYSIFAKIPAYMMSGTPVLIYGPPEVASIEYAIKEKWAYVVKKQDEEALKNAIIELISNPTLRVNLVNRAHKIGLRDFNVIKIRKRFVSELVKTAFSTPI